MRLLEYTKLFKPNKPSTRNKLQVAVQRRKKKKGKRKIKAVKTAITRK